MTSNILLTGRPGIGKSTAVQRIVSGLNEGSAGGFWSGEIRESGRRVGFEIVTLNGDRGILAHVDIDKGPKVSKYTVNLRGINKLAIPSLQRAREEGKIIIIDEIATMELKSSDFAPEVRKCLDTGLVVGTLQQRRGWFQDEIRDRADVRLITLTYDNRDEVPQRVLKHLGQS